MLRESCAGPGGNRARERPPRFGHRPDSKPPKGNVSKASDGTQTPADESRRRASGNQYPTTMNPENTHRFPRLALRKSASHPPSPYRRRKECGSSRHLSAQILFGLLPIEHLFASLGQTPLRLRKNLTMPRRRHPVVLATQPCPEVSIKRSFSVGASRSAAASISLNVVIREVNHVEHPAANPIALARDACL